MNAIDFIIFVILVYFIYVGYNRGLVMVLYGMTSFIISFFLAIIFYSKVSDFIMKNNYLLSIFSKLIGSLKGFLFSVTTIKPYIGLFSMILTFFFFMLILKLLAITFNNIANYPYIRIINKFSGAIIGFFEGALLIYIVLGFLKSLNSIYPTTYWTYIDKSELSKIFLKTVPIYKFFI